MESIWLNLYLFLAFLAIGQAALMALQTWENRRFARSRMREINVHRPRGRAMVFAPCKGVDLELEDNLRALLNQDYDGAYEVAFVVESAEDPACPVIRRIMGESYKASTRLVVAGLTQTNCQKVHNLQAATAQISPDVEYLVFVDSDARPRPEWLRSMVSHLNRPGVGAATGYRWFVPARASWSNYLLYSINCSVALWLGRGGQHLLWGGSCAIRRDVFQSLGVREAWEGRLCDDMPLSALLLKHRLKIIFQPPCMVASPIDQSMGDMLAFVRRQYQLIRCDVWNYWLLALVTGAVPVAAWLTSVGWIVAALLGGAALPKVPLAACAILYVLCVYRGWLRQGLVKTYFPELQDAFRGPQWFDIWSGPLPGLFNYAAVVSSIFGHEVHWRNIRYRWGTGGRIVSVQRESIPVQTSFCWRKAG